MTAAAAGLSVAAPETSESLDRAPMPHPHETLNARTAASPETTR